MAYIGIDLGTTYSAVSVLDASGRARILPNAEGELTTPSVVLFESDREIVVGREAMRASIIDPESVAIDAKRYMGDETFPRDVHGRSYSPVFLSALMIKKLVQDAAVHVGEIHGAVVTVPAYFNEARRQATAAAMATAGIPLIDILNEPTAAALSFAYANLPDAVRGETADRLADTALFEPQTIFVYDLGGGTFDATVLRSEGHHLSVLATAGDVQLGGRDWDERIVELLATKFVESLGDDPRVDVQSLQQLRETAESVKKDLSRRHSARFAVHHAGEVLKGTLTREEFEAATEDLLYRTQTRANRVVSEANTKWGEIDELLVVGGSTRMPAVARMLEKLSGRKVNTSLAPDSAVAQGAAVHAAICIAQGKQPSTMKTAEATTDRTNTSSRTKNGWLAKLGGITSTLRLIRTSNVSAHSLGVVIHDRNGKRRVRHMLPKNTPLPAEVTHRFATQSHNQRRVTVQVVEGESSIPEHSFPVGTCVIASLPPSLPKGSPVDVTFRYDNSGRLQIEALHASSGTWAQTVVERRGGVDDARIDQSFDSLSHFVVS